MGADPEQGLRCAGMWLLVMGILGGVILPSGSLWAFIVGCMLTCCASGETGLRKQISCARCLSITGIVFCAISIIAAVIFGAYIMTAQGLFCGVYMQAIDAHCAGIGARRLLFPSDVGVTPDVKHLSAGMLPHKNLLHGIEYDDEKPTLGGRVLSECASGCLDSWKGDGMCDSVCNNAECNYDNGDCDGGTSGTSCSTGCPDSFLGDGFCDSNCNNADCNYDNGDCTGSEPSGGNGGTPQQQCEAARLSMELGCGWLTGLGLAVLLIPTIYDVIYIIAFSYVLIRSGQLERQPAGAHGGVVMSSIATAHAGNKA